MSTRRVVDSTQKVVRNIGTREGQPPTSKGKGVALHWDKPISNMAAKAELERRIAADVAVAPPVSEKKRNLDTFVIVNETTDPALTHEVLVAMAAALQKQSERDFAPEWEQTPSQFIVGTSADVGTKWVHITSIVDECDEPDALAYHTIDDQGRPVLVAGWNAIVGQAERSGADPIKNGLASALSHEACETRGNEDVNENVDLPGSGAYDTAMEACDWTESDLYDVDGFSMANFCLPAFFNQADDQGPWDHMGLCTGAFELRPGGYYVRRHKASGRYRPIFGKEVSPEARIRRTDALFGGWARITAGKPVAAEVP